MVLYVEPNPLPTILNRELESCDQSGDRVCCSDFGVPGTSVLPRKCDQSSTSHARFHETSFLILVVQCPKLGVLGDVVCRFAKSIPGLKNSTGILPSATCVAFAVKFCV
jgi:hypothetical protein